MPKRTTYRRKDLFGFWSQRVHSLHSCLDPCTWAEHHGSWIMGQRWIFTSGGRDFRQRRDGIGTYPSPKDLPQWPVAKPWLSVPASVYKIVWEWTQHGNGWTTFFFFALQGKSCHGEAQVQDPNTASSVDQVISLLHCQDILL
jgi:hypothetical protein